MYTDREEFEGWMERIMERFDRTEKLLERVLKKNNTLDGEDPFRRRGGTGCETQGEGSPERGKAQEKGAVPVRMTFF